MTKKELETKSIETLEKEYEECFSKYEDFVMILDAKILNLKKIGAEEKIEEVQFEKFLIGLDTENTTDNRFPTLKNEVIRTSFTKERINYIKERIQKTSNNILKAKFSDIIVEINKEEIDFAKTAIDSYLELGKIYLKNCAFDYEFSDVISRALSLSLFYKDQKRVSIAYKQHIDSLEVLLKEQRYASFKKVIKSIVTREKSLKDLNPNFVSFETMIEKAIKDDKGKSQSAYSLNQSLLELLLILPSNKTNPAKIRAIKNRVAESIEEEGDFVGKTRSKMVAGIIYEKALHIHTSIGSSEIIIETLKKKMRATNKESVEKEYRKVSLTFSIPQSVINREFKKYSLLDTIDIINKLSVDYNIIPNYTRAKEENIHLPIFVQKSMREGLNIKSSSTLDEKMNTNIIRLIGIHANFLSQTILNDIFDLLKFKNPNYTLALKDFLKSSSVVAEGRISLITHGVDLYIKNDFISSMHILVFQIEGILRDILHKKKGATFQYKNNESREHTMGAIVRKLEEAEILNINLLKYIEIFLCEIEGKNIRNDIAHGNLNLNHFTKENTQILIQILLMLSSDKNGV